VVRAPRRTQWWLLFPLAYFGYSLLREPAAGFYPYPFLNPRLSGGYGRVTVYVVVLAVVMAGLALLIGAVGVASGWAGTRRPGTRLPRVTGPTALTLSGPAATRGDPYYA